MLQAAVQSADIAALWDVGALNAGFLVVRPSAASQQLYETIRRLTTRRKRLDDQRALNRATRLLKTQHSDHGKLRVNVLNRNRFLSGLDYFEKAGRLFPKPPDDDKSNENALVVHNNWIVGKQAKIYRFREHLMWQYDGGSEQYYSSQTRKCLTYANPTPSPNATRRATIERELMYLRTALIIGHFLNRVVILPRFHCGATAVFARLRQCPLNSIIHIKTFDSILSGLYRENSFLQHPKVPDSVKQGVTDGLFTVSQSTSSLPVTGSNIMRLFGELDAKVLNLTNLHRVKVYLNDESFDIVFIKTLELAFRRSRYRQLH